MKLDKISVACSPLTGEIYIYRFGKERNVALDKRPAEPEVMCAFIEHMLHDMPDGAAQNVRIGDNWYEVSAKPLKEPQ